MSFRNAGLDVDPGDSRLISSASLFAQDRDTPPSELMYMFESVPTQGLLQLKVSAVSFYHIYNISVCLVEEEIKFIHNKSEAT